MQKKIYIVLITLASFSIFWYIWISTEKEDVLYQNLTWNIHKASNASSLSEVEEALDRCVKYLRNKEMTSGNTSLVFKTSEDDVGLFNQNLTRLLEISKEERQNPKALLDSISTSLKRTVVGAKGFVYTELIMPEDLHLYPHNLYYKMWISVSVMVLFETLMKCLIGTGMITGMVKFIFWSIKPKKT